MRIPRGIEEVFDEVALSSQRLALRNWSAEFELHPVVFECGKAAWLGDQDRSNIRIDDVWHERVERRVSGFDGFGKKA